MKKLITLITMIAAGAIAFAQTNNTQVAAATTTQSAVEAEPNFTSIGVSWVEAGMGFAFQTDTGLIGYVGGNYNLFTKDEFMIDLGATAAYTDMSTQVFDIAASIKPAYKFYTYKGVDITFVGNVDVGYGTMWIDDDGYSMVSYALGCGVEFSYQKYFAKPFYNWVNYEAFSDYDVVRNHVAGIELGMKVTDNIAVVTQYSHWFVDNNRTSDNEDRLTFGVRYLF